MVYTYFNYVRYFRRLWSYVHVIGSFKKENNLNTENRFQLQNGANIGEIVQIDQIKIRFIGTKIIFEI